MKISKHITHKEATHSDTAVRNGIENNPNNIQLFNMKQWAEKIFEPLRAGLGNEPIYISSFFRSIPLNITIGGSETSQHCKGEAGDLDNDQREAGPTNKDIFEYIRMYLQFDQLIWEFGIDNPNWVHVSFTENNRNEVLQSYYSGGVKYRYI